MSQGSEHPPAKEGNLPVYAGVRELAGGYDGFILDLWGVIHDGVNLYPGVVDCLGHLRGLNKGVVMLSNAPRRVEVIMGQLAEFGIARDLYDGLVSSGQETWDHLSRRDDPWYAALGRRCYHIGPSRDKNMLEGIALEVVDTPAAAEFILNTGPWGRGEAVSDYEDLLAAAAGRSLPMVCSNPDIEVVRGGKRMICAGALARRYEEMGGEVKYHGKPYPEVYNHCLEILTGADRARVVALGDSLFTDIAGAQNAGLSAIFVAGGLHGEELGLTPGAVPNPERVVALCKRAGRRPDGVIPALVW